MEQTRTAPIQLSERLSFDIIEDGSIWVWKHQNKYPTRKDVDLWIESMREKANALPSGSNWYSINDFSALQLGPSPYIISKVRELAAFRKDLHGHAASIMPKNLLTQILVNAVRTYRSPNILAQSFFNYDEAIKWLKQLQAR
jgi:hypothetical protein